MYAISKCSLRGKYTPPLPIMLPVVLRTAVAYYAVYSIVMCLLLIILQSCSTPRSATSIGTRTGAGMESRMLFGYPALDTIALQSSRTALWATYYHIWHAKDTADGVALLNKKGETVGIKLSPRDWCMSGLEGTVRVTKNDGSVVVYNYDGRGDSVQTDCAPFFNKGSLINPVAIGKSRWRLAQGEFGDGVGNYLLVPYRSLATDRAVIPSGTVVYIPAARGVRITLPSGKQVDHDGYFYAGDIGGAIKTNHIDVFIGIDTKSPFTFIMNAASKTFPAYILAPEQVPARVLEDLRILHGSDR
jgi:3D (Asp-Asp-Asp) domain-containing protein